jgi:hypothetical protein
VCLFRGLLRLPGRQSCIDVQEVGLELVPALALFGAQFQVIRQVHGAWLRGPRLGRWLPLDWYRPTSSENAARSPRCACAAHSSSSRWLRIPMVNDGFNARAAGMFPVFHAPGAGGLRWHAPWHVTARYCSGPMKLEPFALSLACPEPVEGLSLNGN